MFGWEFPPYFAGGVGMVCYELTKQLVSSGIEIEYVMPFAPDDICVDFLRIVDASKKVSDQMLRTSCSDCLHISRIPSLMQAYQTVEEYEKTLIEIKKQYSSHFVSALGKGAGKDNTRSLYGENLLEEIDLFAQRVAVFLEKNTMQDFDVIHAHDWTTMEAAMVAKRILGKPMIVHVHITEVNKNAGRGVNTEVYERERRGFFAADKILAVSGGIKQTLVEHYGISPEKIEVVHNGGIKMAPAKEILDDDFKGNNKIVSYMGRVTGMKGPENFIEVAARVLKYCPQTKFILAGTGDLLSSCIQKTKDLGIYDKFYFHGFYSKEEAEYFYNVSDVFILPSLMEPFGVTPLEAMCKKTPVIVTKQSGVSEVIDHCFKVDFWDLDKMTTQVVSLLTYPKLHATMKEHGFLQAQGLDWQKPARECISIYKELSKGAN